MIPRHRLLPRANADLDEIAEFIAQDNVDAALRLLNAAEHAFATLAEHPRMGRRHDVPSRYLGEIRCWPIPGFENYVIFYQQEPEGVYILRILHGARDLPAILDA